MPLGPQNQGQPTSTILRIIHVRSGELGTVKGRSKPSRTDQARQAAEGCASDQREILKKLHKSLN
jgi:hypothetical protein